MAKINVGVLVSGRGSNLQALIDAARDDFPAKISVVISNKADAYALERAKNAGIKTAVINHRDYESREAFDKEIDRILKDNNVDLVCLAGFMRILTPSLVNEWAGRMINIHPSLLPSFKGLDAQKQALEYGCKVAGCTVHFVTTEMDEGSIILQATVPVLDGDSEADLSARILEQEHKIYPIAVRYIAEGRLAIDGRRTIITQSGD